MYFEILALSERAKNQKAPRLAGPEAGAPSIYGDGARRHRKIRFALLEFDLGPAKLRRMRSI